MVGGKELYGRRCRVTVSVPVSTPGDYSNVTRDVTELDTGDDASGPGLRVVFKITRTREKEPNTANITVYNLSPARRASLQTKGVKVELEAGYVTAGMTRLFIGDARTVDHVREGADWLTKLTAGDGERGFQFARMSESFAARTSASSIIRKLCLAMGVGLGNVDSQLNNIVATFQSGYAVSGPAQRSLDRLLTSLGYSWSIQDGELQLLKPEASLATTIPDIGPDSGLIGSPEMGTPEKKGKKPLVKFKTLLTPTKPGAKVHLRSSRYNGDLTVSKCEHNGDTAGEDWYTEIQGVVSG